MYYTLLPSSKLKLEKLTRSNMNNRVIYHIIILHYLFRLMTHPYSKADQAYRNYIHFLLHIYSSRLLQLFSKPIKLHKTLLCSSIFGRPDWLSIQGFFI